MKTLLLVDDSRDLRFGLSREIRRRCSVEILEAGNGLEALKMVRRHKVDVVLTDVRMPGMLGTVLRDALHRQGFPRKNIFLMSSLPSSGLGVDFRKGSSFGTLATTFLERVGHVGNV